MKNKGFIFIETIIVICVLTVALITLYNNYSKIITNTRELNTFDTTEYNYKTYFLMKKYNVEDLTDGKCTEKTSNFSDTGTVKICRFDNVLEETKLINFNNETSLVDAIMRDNTVSDPLTTPGRNSSTSSEAVLASTEDDYGTSYYFRGNVINNYVNYSGMCWRIVRVQGDGTIKLVLADENGTCNASTYSTDNTKSAFVDERTNIAYKSSPTFNATDFPFEDSDIPAILSAWSTSSEHTLDTSKLVDAEWCNDTAKTGEDDYTSQDGALYSFYAAYDRLHYVFTANPTLKCNTKGMEGTSGIEAKAQRYTNKIGILSADEVTFAGATYSLEIYNYYLQTNASGNYYWTLSPSGLNSGYYSSVWFVDSTGTLNELIVSRGYGSVRPAVVLASNVTIASSGDGTNANPYVVSTNKEENVNLSSVEIYIRNHKDQMDAYIIDYLLKQDLNENNDNLYLVEYKKKDKQNTDKYFTYISSLTY